ncbi:hypothetical protein FIBSPDRAFT_933455 [Athelia psychrophila]|uniref:DUF6534 domain-containing protein n=1 Tax=Athelia psychrophila TaxID=1759441 RepID=A0A166H5V5_9AGAM|nr:hypothetical protein FIBSPDRAFT_933455 [Fibularhizoctonia sp. CBS 109695]
MLVTIGNTAGAAYIGIVLSAVLFGLSTLQTYIYYGRYPNDWKVHRIAVGILWVLDVVHLIFSIMLGYHYLIAGFGNPLALEYVHWTFKAQIAVNVVIIVIVQCLYALRMWKLARGHHHIVMAIIGTAFVAIVCVVASVLAFFMLQPDVFADLRGWTVIASFASICATDTVIAGFMCFYLFKSRSGFAKTNSKLSTLVQYTLGSGLATGACSMAAMVAYCLSPDTLIFAAFEFCLTELYINSFLAMLNARHSINGQSETHAGVSVSLKELHSSQQHHVSPINELDNAKQHLPTLSINQFTYGERKQALSWATEP